MMMRYMTLCIAALFPAMVVSCSSSSNDNNDAASCEVVSLAADIWTGAGSSNASNFTELNGKLYMQANDGVNGDELWAYDPTIGASPVAEIVPGSGGSHPAGLTKLNGMLYFSAADGVHGTELWLHDPNDLDTDAMLVADIFPGANDAGIGGIAAVGSTLYFSAYDGVHGRELWAYDPTATAPAAVLVIDINPGSAASYINNLKEFRGKLYFGATDGTRSGLWAYDPAEPASGAQLVSDAPINGGLTVLDDKLYFAAYTNGTGSVDLWVYDPASGAEWAAGMQGHLVQVAVVEGKIYMGVDEDDKVWVYDPANPAAGAVLVAEVPDSSIMYWTARDFIGLDSRLYFVAIDDLHGSELWMVDSTELAAGAQLVPEFLPGAAGMVPDELTVFENKLYFSASTPETGRELWVHDPDCLSSDSN